MTDTTKRALLWIGADAPALRGALDQDYRVLAGAADVDALAAQIAGEPGGRLDVIATGEGAACALALAAAAPERVGHMVLLAPRLASAPTPVEARALVLVGAADRAGSETGRALKSALPHCHLTYVWGAGADLAAEASGRAIAIVSDFLARGEAFLVRQAG
jgi:pimeloyl-ACP methyl ester carboxylesterase